MVNGEGLLDVLGSGQFGRWVVFHGHTHEPSLRQAPGDSCSPLIFGAGSATANLSNPAFSGVSNQVYVVDFPVDCLSAGRLVGTFTTHMYSPGRGWAPQPSDMSLPMVGGFGSEVPWPQLSKQIRDRITDGGEPEVAWASLVESVPDLPYVLPTDMQRILDELKSKGYEFLRKDGVISRVLWPVKRG